jgi:hypothetical protein
VLATVLIERVHQGVVVRVEFQHLDAEALAQLDVERGAELAPLAVQQQLGIAVPGEHVGAHGLAQLRAGEVVPDVGEAEAGRDAPVARRSGQQHRLRNAPVALRPCHGARPVSLGLDGGGVGVVADAVAHGVEQAAGDLDGVSGIAGCRGGEARYLVAVAVDEPGGREPLGFDGHAMSCRGLAVAFADVAGTDKHTTAGAGSGVVDSGCRLRMLRTRPNPPSRSIRKGP